MIQRKVPFWLALLVALPIQAIGEGVAVWSLGAGLSGGHARGRAHGRSSLARLAETA
jgi:hypothetical protein